MRRIESSDKPASARLPCDHPSRRVGVAICCGRGLSASAVGAAIHVANLHPSLLVDGHVEKVEQVAADIGAAVRPYTTALHRVVWSYIRCRPVGSSVECIGNVEMPNAVEAVCRPVSSCRRTIEGNGGTPCIS